MADESGLSIPTRIPLNKENFSVTSPEENPPSEQTKKQQHHTANGKEANEEASAPSANAAHALPEARTIRGFKWFLACVALFSANFLYGLDTTIAADIQAVVAQTFDDISKLGWLGIGFTLGSVALILPLGKAYAIFDTKWLFLACLTMFAAGSALCGAAPSINAVVVGRVWAGAGGAGMYLGNLNWITILTSPSEQPLYIGIIGLAFGSGLILGPVIGGLFSDSAASWRWAFYINLLIFAVLTPLYLIILPSKPRRPSTTFAQRLRSVDWLGTLLNMGMYVSFVLFCTFGGSIWAWSDGRTVACIVIFAVLLVTFAVTQIFCVWTNAEDRLFPCEMVLNRTLVLLYVTMACAGSSIFVTIYYVPLYFQFVQGDSGTQAAVRLLPFVCFFGASLNFCGYFMPRTGYFIIWYIASGAFLVIGAALMHVVDLNTPVAKIYGYSILIALGTTTSQAGYAVAPTLVPLNRIHEAIQLMNAAQGQSLLLGLTITSAIFQNKAFSGLQAIFSPLGYSDADIRQAVAGAKSTLLTDSTPQIREQALNVVVQTIDNVYLMIVAAGALYIVCSCFLPRTKKLPRRPKRHR